MRQRPPWSKRVFQSATTVTRARLKEDRGREVYAIGAEKEEWEGGFFQMSVSGRAVSTKRWGRGDARRWEEG